MTTYHRPFHDGGASVREVTLYCSMRRRNLPIDELRGFCSFVGDIPDRGAQPRWRLKRV
jgi:hypothetical protein